MLKKLKNKSYLSAIAIGMSLSACVFAAPPSGYSWQQTFVDEFNGSALDTSKWQTTWYGRHDFPTTGDKTYYSTDNISVGGGTLTITAKDDGHAHPDYDNQWANWTSAQLHTWDKFDQKNGYYEIKFRVDKSGKGVWPAFWLSPPAGADNWPPEVDWFEIFGDNQELWFTYWWKDSNGDAQHNANNYSLDASQWVTLGGYWDYDEGRLEWYVNGNKWHQVPSYNADKIPNVDMYLSIIIQVGALPVPSSWGGDPDASVPFPINYEIDYVKVWQKDTGGTTPPPATGNGLYKIKNHQSGYYLTAEGNGNEWATLSQAAFSNWGTQKWSLVDLGNNEYRIQPEYPNNYVLTADSNGAGNAVYQANWNNWGSQKWTKVTQANGTVILQPVSASGLCLELEGTWEWASIQQDTCDSSSDEYWVLESL